VDPTSTWLLVKGIVWRWSFSKLPRRSDKTPACPCI
jgi:hypothetical protein